jgi:hypothetical protein
MTSGENEVRRDERTAAKRDVRRRVRHRRGDRDDAGGSFLFDGA